MKIVFNDGGILRGERITVMFDMLSVDDIYDVATADVAEIIS